MEKTHKKMNVDWEKEKVAINKEFNNLGLVAELDLLYVKERFVGIASFQEFKFEPKSLLEKLDKNSNTKLKNALLEITDDQQLWAEVSDVYYVLAMALEENEFGIYAHREMKNDDLTDELLNYPHLSALQLEVGDSYAI